MLHDNSAMRPTVMGTPQMETRGGGISYDKKRKKLKGEVDLGLDSIKKLDDNSLKQLGSSLGMGIPKL